MQQHNGPMIAMPNAPKTNETKPRLGKDEVDILEREFQKNPKPTTQTKRQFAEDMKVDLARINNWFQNRRAKRKQEKKQEAYEAGQAQEALNYSEPSSPDAYPNSNGYYSDSHLVPATPATFPIVGPPPAVASYNPQYTDPSTASMESLQRTLAAAQAATEQREEYQFVEQQINTFGGPVAHGFAESDRAQFPPADETFVQFDHSQSFSYPTGFASSVYGQSVSEMHSSPEDSTNQTPTPYNSFPASGTDDSVLHPITTTFPSQLLLAHCNDVPALSADSGCSLSPEDSNASAYGIGLNIETSSSSPAPSIPFKSPPPMNIAARRKKVQHKPMALSAAVMISRPPMGPRTHSHAEGFRRPSDSPCSSPMRRIVSAGGNRPNGVLSGRINKSGVESAQKSPIYFGGFESAGNFLEHNYHSLRNPPSLTGSSSLSSSLAPPTPMSPRGMTFVKREKPRSSQSTASPEDGSLNFVFHAGVPGCFTTMDGDDQNLQSPPETPQAPILVQPTFNNWSDGTEFSEKQWSFEVPDEPLYTPGIQDTFPMEIHMPRPSYLSTMSQPVTPAFGPTFNAGFTFGHESPPQFKQESPHCGMSTHRGQEYAFPDSNPFPPGMSPNMNKQKTFQFSHTTAADFSEK